MADCVTPPCAAPAETVHVPVLFDAVMEALAPVTGAVMVDGTLGGGGHAAGLLARGARVLACDWDALAHHRTEALAAMWGDKLYRRVGGYDQLDALLRDAGVARVDGILLDLGLSSDQLDAPERGLSYHADGPLDMRLRSDVGVTAADVVNTWREDTLADMLRDFGEEPRAKVLARALVQARKTAPLRTTRDLLRVIEHVYPAKHQKRSHPAARIFQALRVVVNDELGQLARALPAAAAALAPGGRLAVITFQPLEDRLVKHVYRDLARDVLDDVGRVVAPAPFKIWKKMEPDADELSRNPRARSAKLRVLEKLRDVAP